MIIQENIEKCMEKSVIVSFYNLIFEFCMIFANSTMNQTGIIHNFSLLRIPIINIVSLRNEYF